MRPVRAFNIRYSKLFKTSYRRPIMCRLIAYCWLARKGSYSRRLSTPLVFWSLCISTDNNFFDLSAKPVDRHFVDISTKRCPSETSRYVKYRSTGEAGRSIFLSIYQKYVIRAPQAVTTAKSHFARPKRGIAAQRSPGWWGGPLEVPPKAKTNDAIWVHFSYNLYTILVRGWDLSLVNMWLLCAKLGSSP